MIRHIVMWRLKERPQAGTRFAQMDEIEKNLTVMRASIPGLREIWVGINEVAVPDAADLVLYSEFENWAALHGYESHPLHNELRAIIGPLRGERRVVDYAV